jgi:hypothetical protein
MSDTNSGDGTPLYDAAKAPVEPPVEPPVEAAPEAPVEAAPEAPVETVEFTRVFTVGSKHNAVDTELDGFNHDGGLAATAADAIAAGLRPTGEVEFVGAEVNADGITLDLTYRVSVVAAAAPTDSVTPGA